MGHEDTGTRLRLLALLAALATLVLTATSAGAPGDTFRVSLTAGGGESNGDSVQASISGDGNRVAFRSLATDMVAGDTNAVADIFVRDRGAGTTIRASVGPGGVQGNALSQEPALSSDGNVVAFASDANNLVAGDTNGWSDVFVHDLGAGTTARVSVSSSGGQSNRNSFRPSISATGRFVTFDSDATTLGGPATFLTRIYVHDRQTGQTELVSVASDETPAAQTSQFGSISDDGRYVAFRTLSALDPADTNGRYDVYVRDRTAGTTTWASAAQAGGSVSHDAQGPTISGDGSHVAFATRSPLVAADTNNEDDVYVAASDGSTLARASVTTTGAQASRASVTPDLSYDATMVAFASDADDLVADDDNSRRDVFVHNRGTGKTSRESLSHTGQQVNADSTRPSLTATGTLVAFESLAPDLVTGDANGKLDVFVHELGVRDITPPVVTGAPDRPANAGGWYDDDVTITWTSVDPTPSAGAPSQPPPTAATTEGQSVPYTSDPSCDPNGNCATGTLTLSIDKTDPTLVASLPTANPHGWYDRDVLIAWGCADSLSGITACPAPELVTTEGAGQTRTETVSDRAGNETTVTTAPISIDKTLPTIVFTGATTYGVDDVVEITCTAADALSGLDEAACPDVTGPAYLFNPGGNSVGATATDLAGNTRRSTFTFTITVTAESLAGLACQFAGTSGHARAVCRKLERLLDDIVTAANASKKDKAVREYQMTASKESGRLFTAQQVALLTRLAASL